MRIAFIALSGVRACDPELTALGLSLPGFVERGRVIASLPSLGLLTLAGMSREHETIYIEARDLAAIDLASQGWDFAALSCLTAQAFEAYALADRLRAAGTPVVIGGLHATACPDECAQHADAVIVGQGEPVWPRVLADAERGRLARRYEAGAPDAWSMAESPMPAFDLLDVDRYNRITVQTSRGCPFRCEFCASSVTLTRGYHQKPIDRVLAEIDRIKEIWPRPYLEFADDNSVVDRRYWRTMLPRLRERRVRWFTETDISIARDPDLLDAMRAAGCDEVLIGLESPERDGLDGLETRTNWKLRQFPTALDAVRRIQQAGIRVNGCFILGLDGQTPAVFDAVEAFADAAGLFDVQVTLLTPFPGTPLYDRLEREGRLTHPGEWDRCTLFDLNYEPRPMASDELRAGFLDLVRRIYDTDAVRRRREQFSADNRRPPFAA